MHEVKNTLLNRRRLIQNGLMMAVGGVGLPDLFSEPAEARYPSNPSAARETWTIGSDRIKRTVRFKPGLGLFTERLSDLATNVDFIVPGKLRMDMAAEFSFECNGRTYRGV